MAITDCTTTRFWSKVNKTTSNGCWLWLGAPDKDGYGRFWHSDLVTRAHRFSWEITNGPIENDLQVLHKCDNPPCVNPEHLFLGTYIDNMIDKALKGRQAFGSKNGAYTHPEKVRRGENNNKSKLTEEKVREIRLAILTGKSTIKIAKEFGVVKGTIQFIKQGKTWKHVN